MFGNVIESYAETFCACTEPLHPSAVPFALFINNVNHTTYILVEQTGITVATTVLHTWALKQVQWEDTIEQLCLVTKPTAPSVVLNVSHDLSPLFTV